MTRTHLKQEQENPDKMSEIKYVKTWQKNDARIEQDVLQAWKDHNILPTGAAPLQRVKEVCVVAYDGDKIAGISTMELVEYPPLRQRFGFFRAFTLPDYGRQDIARHLAVHCRDVLCQWSLDHPRAKIAGMMAIYQAKGLGHKPVGFSGLTLIGYNSLGHQVRVIWFDHAEIEV